MKVRDKVLELEREGSSAISPFFLSHSSVNAVKILGC